MQAGPRWPAAEIRLVNFEWSGIAPAAGRRPSFVLYVETDYDRESGNNELSLQNFGQRPAKPGWRRRYFNTGGFHSGNLGLGVALAAGNDRPGMAHAAAGWRRSPGDKSHYRLLAAALDLVLEELSGVFFPRAADLTDHHDRLRRLVGQKHFEDVDELGALHG